MGELLSTVGGRILDAALASVVVTGLAALAMVVTRQPSRRRALARAGVLGALLTIPLVCLRPFDPIELIAPLRVALEPTLAWIAARLGVARPLAPPSWLATPRPLVPSIELALLVVYLVGLVVGLGRLALGWWGSGWIGRNSEPAPEATQSLLQSLPFADGRARPRLRVSSRTTRPVLLGMFRPAILIPPDLARPEAAEGLRLALLHELAHAEASDPWFGLASEMASVVWFPLPPLWWIRRQMRIDQEFLADREASTNFGTSRTYAASLVEIAATPRVTTAGAARSTAAEGAGSALFQRVMMLVRCPFPIERHPPRWWRCSLGIAALVVLPVATGLTLRARTSAAQARSADPAPRSFSLPQLVLNDAPGAVGPTILPIRLPDQFDLRFEIYADAAALADILVLGHPLAGRPHADTHLLDDPPRWHRVEIRRAQRVLTRELDAHPLTALTGASADEWVSLQVPPGRPITLRSIQLSW